MAKNQPVPEPAEPSSQGRAETSRATSRKKPAGQRDDDSVWAAAAGQIVDVRVRRKKTEYRVRWAGWTEHDDTWQLGVDIIDKTLISGFESLLPDARAAIRPSSDLGQPVVVAGVESTTKLAAGGSTKKQRAEVKADAKANATQQKETAKAAAAQEKAAAKEEAAAEKAAAKEKEAAEKAAAKEEAAAEKAAAKEQAAAEKAAAKEQAAAEKAAAKEEKARAKEATKAERFFSQAALKAEAEAEARAQAVAQAKEDEQLIDALFARSTCSCVDCCSKSALSAILIANGGKNCTATGLSVMDRQRRLTAGQREAIRNTLPQIDSAIEVNRQARLQREEVHRKFMEERRLKLAEQEKARAAYAAEQARLQEQLRQRAREEEERRRQEEVRRQQEARAREAARLEQQRQASLQTAMLELRAPAGAWIDDRLVLTSKQPAELSVRLTCERGLPSLTACSMVLSLEYDDGAILGRVEHASALPPTVINELRDEHVLSISLATTSRTHSNRRFRLKIAPTDHGLAQSRPGLVAVTPAFALVPAHSMELLQVYLTHDTTPLLPFTTIGICHHEAHTP